MTRLGFLGSILGIFGLSKAQAKIKGPRAWALFVRSGFEGPTIIDPEGVRETNHNIKIELFDKVVVTTHIFNCKNVDVWNSRREEFETPIEAQITFSLDFNRYNKNYELFGSKGIEKFITKES